MVGQRQVGAGGQLGGLVGVGGDALIFNLAIDGSDAARACTVRSTSV